MRALTFALAALASVSSACASHRTAPAAAASSLATAESLYLELRDLRDRIDLRTEVGKPRRSVTVKLDALVADHNALRQRISSALEDIDSIGLGADDARALEVMRTALARDLGPVSVAEASRKPARGAPGCDYDARILLQRQHGLDSLRSRMYSCYAWAQSHVIVAGDTTDRLSVLGMLGRTESPAKRRELFLSLAPVWRSVNGDNAGGSPYRQLIAREVSGPARHGATCCGAVASIGSATRLAGGLAARGYWRPGGR